MADVVRSSGYANLKNSEAAINYSEARSREMDNYKQWTNTYFETRAMNRKYREAERGPRPTMEDAVRYAQMGRPKRLSPGELDSVTGGIQWPLLLRGDEYAQERDELDAIFSQRARTGVLDASVYVRAREIAQEMTAELKNHVADVPPDQYVIAKNFLKSLAYEAQMPAG
jgi:hypothetical protein